MNDKKIIAQYLYDMAKESKTEFIEDAKIDEEIKEIAKKINLTIPNPDVSVFKTVWARLDVPNLNGVRLPRKVVEEGLNSLLFKQVNFEHEGAGHVCGITIDAKIVEDRIETINIFYKSLFPDQFEELKEKIKSGDAAVSFEIWSISPETKKSVLKILADGTKEFLNFVAHGTGLLLINPPAEPTAKIFKLVANNLADEAKEFVHNVFSDNLVCASLAIENNEKEDNVMDEVKKLEVKLPEEQEKLEQAQVIESVKEEQKTDEQAQVDEILVKKEEEKSEAKPEETPKAEAETKVEEPKVEEKAEEKKEEVAEDKKEEAQPLETIEPKIVVKVTSIFSEVRIDTYVDGTPSGLHDVKGYSKKITEYKDGTKDEVEEEVEIKKKYDLAELEEKVNAAKTEKDTEISSLKTECENLDKEIKKLKDELDTKNQEIAELKTPKVEVKKEKELTVGAVEIEKDSEIKRRAKDINRIISESKGK